MKNFIFIIGLLSAMVWSVYLNLNFWQWIPIAILVIYTSYSCTTKEFLILAFIVASAGGIGLYNNGTKKHVYLIKMENGLSICYQAKKDISEECLKSAITSKSGKYISHQYIGKDFVK